MVAYFGVQAIFLLKSKDIHFTSISQKRSVGRESWPVLWTHVVVKTGEYHKPSIGMPEIKDKQEA